MSFFEKMEEYVIQKKRRSKRARKKIGLKPSDWLAAITGHDGRWWVARVQSFVTKHARPTRDPKHKTAEPEKIIADLTREIMKAAKKTNRVGDGNMLAACALSLILATWYLRLSRAKSYDPRRPVRLRKAAYFSRLNYAAALFLAMEDESFDQGHFPGQNWETPFDPRTTDGYFI